MEQSIVSGLQLCRLDAVVHSTQSAIKQAKLEMTVSFFGIHDHAC